MSLNVLESLHSSQTLEKSSAYTFSQAGCEERTFLTFTQGAKLTLSLTKIFLGALS